MIIKDYGFASYLIYKNYEYSITGDKEVSFRINEDTKSSLLKQYRKSPFYEYDNISRMIKKELKS